MPRPPQQGIAFLGQLPTRPPELFAIPHTKYAVVVALIALIKSRKEMSAAVGGKRRLGDCTLFVKDGQGRLCQSYTVENNGGVPLSGFALQFNKNTFGLVPETPGKLGEVLPGTLAPGQSATGQVPLLATGQPATDTPPGVIQVAIKNNVKVFYFQDSMDAPEP